MLTYPIEEKLPLSSDCSFIAKTFTTPEYELGWHRHIEYELVLIIKGEGMGFIGNHIGEYQAQDIYFIGSNLPHAFPKKQAEMTASALVIQFKDNFWGNDFLNLPECKRLRALLNKARYGIKLTGSVKDELATSISALEHKQGLQRIIGLCQCLDIMSQQEDIQQLSTLEAVNLIDKDNEKINKIFQYTMQSFQQKISLKEVADLACMSVPAFCNYFKKRTKKTYFDFLAEIRISHACNLLLGTVKPIGEVCFESGYNSLPNFRKQFFKLKKISPLQYRKKFSGI